MITTQQISDWPGKSENESGIEHPAIYHMLDVAAVAEILIEPLSLSKAEKDGIALLTALHDLGKLTDSFRNMLRGISGQTYKHWELTEIIIKAAPDALLAAMKVDDVDLLSPLVGATAGHHGRPVRRDRNERKRAGLLLSGQKQNDTIATIAAFAELWPDAVVPSGNMNHFSWWLSGLVTTADWIGSNVDWFPAVEAGPGLLEYLELARGKARRAVSKAGLGKNVPSGDAIFDWPELRPMQAACSETPLTNGPMLAVIEDETGAGKTEAALVLAQRMLQAGKANGLFFALPTMATADAMFSRVSKAVGKMFVDRPSLTLAHGRAGLSDQFHDIRIGSPNAPDDVTCTEWLTDSRHRALLANVGVGTVDQALLSVLPVKFQTLRHYGLASKILIVDEVHELGDPYIAVGLAQLLRMHRNAGGSAILLTATLPLVLRHKLLAAYDASDDLDPAYPALTVANGTAVRDLPADTGPKGIVKVERLQNSAEAIDLIVEKASTGAACVWVRNAVDDAIAAVEELRSRGIEADLLHARYTLGDRKRVEKAALQRFGKTGSDRVGKVLVGTQVLESSLDLDFDVMVSDLAPMAGLIQRAGRLWRHMDLRPASQRPVSEPVLYVVSPDPAQVNNADWLTKVLDKGAYVYSVDVMWRTAVTLFKEGCITAPARIRPLIEATYADKPQLPAVLHQAESERLGHEQSHRSHAWQNVVDIDRSYSEGGQANDDAAYPTRLGPEQRKLMLVRHTVGGLKLFCAGVEGEALSEVSASAKKLGRLSLPDQTSPEIAYFTRKWPEWKRSSITVCPIDDNGLICDGLRYSSSLGLEFVTHLI